MDLVLLCKYLFLYIMNAFGFIGYENNYMVYRLRYTNLELGYKVLSYFKSYGLDGLSKEYTSKHGKVLIIEVRTLTSIPINKAKILTIDANIGKLKAKKVEIQQSLF